MSGSLVLLTGASGHVGFKTLRILLQYGYKVRAVARSQKSADSIKNNPALTEANDNNLSFVLIPDFSAPDAFDRAAEGVEYIVHIASPIPDDKFRGADLEADMVVPAVTGTLSIFESARKAGSVKRIVITSSAVTLVPAAVLMGAPSDETFGPEHYGDDIPPPYMNEPGVAYIAAKTNARRAAEDFIKREQPSFDAIHIFPTYVIGRNEQTKTTEEFKFGSNWIMLGCLLGHKEEQGKPAVVIYLDDVALAHVRALDPKVKGNQNFILSTDEKIQWEDAKDIVRKHFPKEVEQGLLPLDGSQFGPPANLDSSTTKEILGIKYKSFEDQVVEVVSHYLEVLKKEKGL
ncbi:Ketoreductase CTB6-like protein [Elsinoe fawcettii]|nr:Ketoreductase CTB6-like protein [Elsinoe fawcettii]